MELDNFQIELSKVYNVVLNIGLDSEFRIVQTDSGKYRYEFSYFTSAKEYKSIDKAWKDASLCIREMKG